MEFKRLGDIATYINGYAFKPEQWSNNGRPIIRIQNLNNKDAVYNYFDGDINEKYVIRKGDYIGKACKDYKGTCMDADNYYVQLSSMRKKEEFMKRIGTYIGWI